MSDKSLCNAPSFFIRVSKRKLPRRAPPRAAQAPPPRWTPVPVLRGLPAWCCAAADPAPSILSSRRRQRRQGGDTPDFDPLPTHVGAMVRAQRCWGIWRAPEQFRVGRGAPRAPLSPVRDTYPKYPLGFRIPSPFALSFPLAQSSSHSGSASGAAGGGGGSPTNLAKCVRRSESARDARAQLSPA